MGASNTKDESTSAKSSQSSKQASPKSSQQELRNDSGVKHNEDDSNAQDVDDDDSDAKTQVPMQKRRRVTRACDECRRKKIKCDGKQPCTHCTVYSYDCTYDQPSNRRRNPAPQYIEALELRLQKAEALLKSVLPDIDIDDPKYDAHSIEQILKSNKAPTSRVAHNTPRQEDDAQMRSMVDRTGSLDIDDSGYYDYHGTSSGYTFMRKFRAQFGDDFLPSRPLEIRNLIHLTGSPKSFLSSPFETGMSLTNELPPKDVAIEFCRSAIDDCCALQRPVHRPTFFRRLSALYDVEPENYSNEHVKFLPLLYAAMSVGCLFGRNDDEKMNLDKKGYRSAMEQGFTYFNIAKTMLDVTDCREMMSIQAVMFMILFLQGTAKLATCYAYVGVALRACCRLGMHRKLVGKFDVVEQEERKRLFWAIRKMDIYVGAMLGLPMMLSDDDIDQELPSETFDENITETAILPISPDAFSLMKATNAHTRLLRILQKVVRYIYPIKPSNDAAASGECMINHSLIRELERDLQDWMDELPMQLRPSENADTELSRVQQLLRMSYAYVQMMFYRPFLHYVAQACQTRTTDKRSFACAAACVSVARNIVHITSEMKRRGLLMGAYWFVMYTTYFAILSLLYFVLENPESSTSKDILKDAVEGRDTLANLATRSMAADRCSASLAGLFEALPEKLNERRSSLRTTSNTARKRPPPGSDPPFFGNPQLAGQFGSVLRANADISMAASAQSRKLPQEYLKTATKHSSVPDPSATSTPQYPFTPEASYATVSTPVDTIGPMSSHPLTSTPLDFGTPALIHGHLPDLKNVMFPGDNPFAYPNQPMSTLDMMPNLPFDNDANEAMDQYPAQANLDTQPHFPHRYGTPQHFQGGFSNSQSHNPQQFFNVNHVTDEPAPLQGPTNTLQVPGQDENDDYWSHAPARGRFRTGLTPGAPAVNLNLDELFGNGQGWSMPMNLAMPEHTERPQRDMQWPGQGGPSWQ